MASWTTVRRALGLTIAGIGLVLGGCGVAQTDFDALKAENEDLRGRIASCESAGREKDTRIAEMESQRNNWQNNTGGGVTRGSLAPNGGGGEDSGLDFRHEGNNAVLAITGEVLFDSGQATLKSGAKKELDKVAKALNGKYAGKPVRIEGHTDSDPIRKSKFASNDALSDARANAVREYLVSKGVSSGRVSAVGFGSSKPKATKPQSRRVEIVVVGG